jgi:chromate transporter
VSFFLIFRVFLLLGCTSFGGPIAHLAVFQREFVQKRQWLSAQQYSELVALCQFLPGPASSQVGMALGLLRAGLPGLLAAFIGFTLPSALLMTVAALSLQSWQLPELSLHLLKLLAAAVVAQALWSMQKSLCANPAARLLALLCALLLLLMPGSAWQLLLLMLAALAGRRWLRPSPGSAAPLTIQYPARLSRYSAGLFALGLLCSVVVWLWPQSPLALAGVLWQSGALVFGGGHVLLPLLQTELVPAWLSADSFLASYALTQAMPGPMFSFAAFVGATAAPGGWPLLSATLAIVLVFLPGALVLLAALPHWQQLRQRPALQAALQGVGAAVVGILLASWLDLMLPGAIQSPLDFIWLLLLLVLQSRLPLVLLVAATLLLPLVLTL